MISMVRIFFVRTLSYVNIFILILIGNGACVTKFIIIIIVKIIILVTSEFYIRTNLLNNYIYYVHIY